MEETDDIKLLKECDAGVQMAISSIDEVLEKISDDQLKELLEESREHHEKLAKEIRHQLIAADSSGKEPNLMAKGMSWIKTNVMIEMSDRSTESVVADLITDGCISLPKPIQSGKAQCKRDQQTFDRYRRTASP